MKPAVVLFCALALRTTPVVGQAADTLSPGPTTVESALADRVAGCYEVATGEARADTSVMKIASVPPGPIRFALTKRAAPRTESVAAFEHRFYFEVETDTLLARGRGLFATWVRLPGREDRIVVSRPLPMAGVALYVTPRGADLVGEITAFTDAIPPDGKNAASHAIVARRTNCNGLR